MSDNGGFGPASARMLLIASSLSRSCRWRCRGSGSTPTTRPSTELIHQWSGWGLAGESTSDGHVPLDVFAVIPMVLAVRRAAVPGLSGGARPRQGASPSVATGLGCSCSASRGGSGLTSRGEYGDAGPLVAPLFGLAVCRIALFAFLVSAAAGWPG